MRGHVADGHRPSWDGQFLHHFAYMIDPERPNQSSGHSPSACIDSAHTNTYPGSLTVGTKLHVRKTVCGQDSYHRAEILAIRHGNHMVTRSSSPHPSSSPANTPPPGTLSFYVHYGDFNKRLDEWVDVSRLDLSGPIEFPTPKSTKPKKVTAHKCHDHYIWHITVHNHACDCIFLKTQQHYDLVHICILVRRHRKVPKPRPAHWHPQEMPAQKAVAPMNRQPPTGQPWNLFATVDQ